VKFDLVRLWSIKQGETYHYNALIHSGMHAKGRTFLNREQLVAVLNDIIVARGPGKSIEEVMRLVESEGSFDFVGVNALDLTPTQAESLGWKQ
jgi:hypothetical protein